MAVTGGRSVQFNTELTVTLTLELDLQVQDEPACLISRSKVI